MLEDEFETGNPDGFSSEKELACQWEGAEGGDPRCPRKRQASIPPGLMLGGMLHRYLLAAVLLGEDLPATGGRDTWKEIP